MASGGTFTVLSMGSFKRALLGYRRQDVDAAIASRDARLWALEQDVEDAIGRWRSAAVDAARCELELEVLARMVIERDREIHSLDEQLREANERHDRSVASLESVAERLEEIQAQARGQATRIRMKALSEAVEVSRRAQELIDAQSEATKAEAPHADGSGDGSSRQNLFEGRVRVEVGPLADFSQLVGFEDAIDRLGASEISVERFSEGRATLSMRFEEPVELLRELETRSALDFRVRRTSGDDLILDVTDDRGPEQQAA